MQTCEFCEQKTLKGNMHVISLLNYMSKIVKYFICDECFKNIRDFFHLKTKGTFCFRDWDIDDDGSIIIREKDIIVRKEENINKRKYAPIYIFETVDYPIDFLKRISKNGVFYKRRGRDN